MSSATSIKWACHESCNPIVAIGCIPAARINASCLYSRSAPALLARWHAGTLSRAAPFNALLRDAAQSSTMGFNFNDSAAGRYFKMDERKHITM